MRKPKELLKLIFEDNEDIMVAVSATMIFIAMYIALLFVSIYKI